MTAWIFHPRRWPLAAGLVFAGLAYSLAGAAADETRYYVENGVTYRETRQTTQHPLVTTEMQSRQQTVWRPRVTSETREVTRNWYVPITEYSWQQRWERGWNPFAPPVLTQRYLPQTRWELRSDTVRAPVNRYDYVQESATVQSPVTVQRFAERQIITRVAVGSAAPSSGGASTTQVVGDPFARPQGGGTVVGGIAQLDQEPPRSAQRPTGAMAR
jgi:hypothetical protein